MIKNIVFYFGMIIFTVGCSVTQTTYEGTMIFPQNIMFDKPNFKYIKTISGSSQAKWANYGGDVRIEPNGLINTAKMNMYAQHKFMPNQVITNISKDIIRTSSNEFEVKVVMSADIYEFSDDGTYFPEEEVIVSNHDQLTFNVNKESILIEDIESNFFLGDKIIYKLLDDPKEYYGILTKCNDNNIVISNNGETKVIYLSKLESITEN